MDREKVIKGLELCTNISQDGCLMLCPYKDEKDETYSGFCEHVLKQDALALLKEQEQEWVPVCERLPEERHSVLVYCPEYRNIFCAYYYKDEWLFFGGGCKPIDEKVSHWRVLPESPIEDGGDGDQVPVK